MLARAVQKPLAVSHLRYRIADSQGSIGEVLAGKRSASPDTQTAHANASRLTKSECSALKIFLQPMLVLQLMSTEPLCNWHEKLHRPCTCCPLPCHSSDRPGKADQEYGRLHECSSQGGPGGALASQDLQSSEASRLRHYLGGQEDHQAWGCGSTPQQLPSGSHHQAPAWLSPCHHQTGGHQRQAWLWWPPHDCQT